MPNSHARLPCLSGSAQKHVEKAQLEKESRERDFETTTAQVQVVRAHVEEARHRALKLKEDVARLHEARAVEARTMLLAFGIRPIIQDKTEAKLARAEQLKGIVFSEAHARSYGAAVALRHLVSLGQWKQGGNLLLDTAVAGSIVAYLKVPRIVCSLYSSCMHLNVLTNMAEWLNKGHCQSLFTDKLLNACLLHTLQQNAKALLGDALGYTSTATSAAQLNSSVGEQLFAPDSELAMNSVREVVNAVLGVQVAKSAGMELLAAREVRRRLMTVCMEINDNGMYYLAS